MTTDDRHPPPHPTVRWHHRSAPRGLPARRPRHGDRSRRCPQRGDRPARRRGIRIVRGLRWAGPGARPGAGGRRRPPVQPVPHHGHLCPHPGRHAHRPEPPHGAHGPHHRGGHLLPGLRHRHPPGGGHRGRGSPPARVRHRDVRQGPPHPVVGDRPRPARPGRSTVGPPAWASTASTASPGPRPPSSSPTSTTRRRRSPRTRAATTTT